MFICYKYIIYIFLQKQYNIYIFTEAQSQDEAKKSDSRNAGYVHFCFVFVAKTEDYNFFYSQQEVPRTSEPHRQGFDG